MNGAEIVGEVVARALERDRHQLVVRYAYIFPAHAAGLDCVPVALPIAPLPVLARMVALVKLSLYVFNGQLSPHVYTSQGP